MREPLREVISTFAVVTLATLMLSAAGRLAPLAEHVPLLVGALFLWTALHMAQRQPGGLGRYGLRLGGLLEPPAQAPVGVLASARDLVGALARATPIAAREAAVALGIAALVFPPFVVGFQAWHDPRHAFELALPPELGSYALTQLLVVALPEEALFRGYMQGRLGERWPARQRLLGALVSPRALVAQAALFALIHFAVDPNPARLAVFFPGLLFGWLRELRGGIGAAAVFHAGCNLLSDTLARSWL